jgi:hypothetical protein
MKVHRDEKALKEGGDEDEGRPSGPKSKEDRYKERTDSYNCKDSGLNAETGLNFERGCTDMICALVFLCFVATMLGTAFYGIVKGDPRAMVKPYDFTRSICGVNDTVKDYGKLYFTKLAPSGEDLWKDPADFPKRIVFENAVCVKSCPKTVDDKIKGFPYFAFLSQIPSKIECPPGDKYAEKCKVDHIVATTSVGDLCWPKFSTLSADQKANWKLVVRSLEKNVVFAQIMNMTTAYRAVIFSMLTAFLLCIIYIYFMSIFAEYVAWAIIIMT